jgi:chorismate-pyruvate lyase
MVHINWLVQMFHDDPNELGVFESVDITELPEVYKTLLAHSNHMTVTVEKHHGCLVDVEVIQARREDPFYSREILLRRQSDRKVVMYGIVRLFLPSLQQSARDEILAGNIPLGRVLINHDVLRQVRLGELWHITSHNNLAWHFGQSDSIDTYGRTALIYFNEMPALELLEIMAPEE